MKKRKPLTKAQLRSRNIEVVIRQLWCSMDTHLAYTYKTHQDSNAFHRKTVKEYALAIYKASLTL